MISGPVSIMLLPAVAVAVVCFLWWRRPIGAPPGPAHIPLIGTAALCAARNSADLHRAFTGIFTAYGNVAGFYFGGLYTVLIAGLPTIRKAMNKWNTSGRMENASLQMLAFGKRCGILMSEGERWKENSTIVRDILMGMLDSGEVDRMVSEEAAELVSVIRSSPGGVVQVKSLFRPRFVGFCWRLITGRRLSRQHSQLITRLFHAKMVALGNTWIESSVLRYLFPQRSGYVDLLRYRDTIRGLFAEAVNTSGWHPSQPDSFDTDKENNPFISTEYYRSVSRFEILKEANPFKMEESEYLSKPHDETKPFESSQLLQSEGTFISEFRKRKLFLLSNPRRRWSPEEDEDLVMFLFDFLLVGCPASSSLLEWSLVYLLRHPQLQQELQQELAAATGGDRSAELLLQHRYIAPRFSSLESEVLRRCSVLQSSLHHRAVDDVDIAGYCCPAGSAIIYDIVNTHMSRTVWKDPLNFRPGRFLTAEGKFLKNDSVMAYGEGLRRCPAEAVSSAYYFLMIAGLLREFKVTLPPGECAPTEEACIGMTRDCLPFTACFEDADT